MGARARGKTGTRTVIVRPRFLADRFAVPLPRSAYALPYFTRHGADTEYLLSNASATTASATLLVYGKDCKIAKRLEFKLKPNCTATFRLGAIVPDHAGHSVLITEVPLIGHLLYLRNQDTAVVGGELSGRDNLFTWLSHERTRIYGFGYRALPLGHDTLAGSVFISNPHGALLTGTLVFYDQRCEPAMKKRIAVAPGCTTEYPFPKDRYGYGRLQVSAQAVLNVLHFAASARGVAAAELLGESNLLDVPADQPKLGTKILFDNTHSCRPGVTGDWTTYESALVSAGYTVSHYTLPSITLAELQKHDVFAIVIPRTNYSAMEKTAISDFVNGGGGLMIVQDHGNAPWSFPTRDMMNLFGASDDNNFIEDPTNHYNPGQFDDVVFDYQRNFLSHPILTGWKSFHVDAASSLSGGSGWTTIVETDDDSTPARRPALMVRGFGSGRTLVFGDSNTWANHLISHLENKTFGIRTMEWLLFQI